MTKQIETIFFLLFISIPWNASNKLYMFAHPWKGYLRRDECHRNVTATGNHLLRNLYDRKSQPFLSAVSPICFAGRHQHTPPIYTTNINQTSTTHKIYGS